MNLRIEKIADMVKPGVIAADIGTDHAFLPILLIRKNIARKVYACDVNEGPLKAAKRNIAREGLSGQIETVLCDGFDGVPYDTECAVIAGMGYYTCAGILEKALKRLDELSQIIVEVNRNNYEMRKWISDHHFTIDDECLIHEKGFDYIAISFHTAYHESYDEEELLCGTELLRTKEGYVDYCGRMISRIDDILSVYKKEDARREHLQMQRSLWLKAKVKTR